MLIEARSRAAQSRLSELTPRERELLAEIAKGKSNGAIAESLVLTKRAVEKHVNSIFAKLDLPETEDVSRRVKATLIFLSEEEQGAVDRRVDRSGLSPSSEDASAAEVAETRHTYGHCVCSCPCWRR